MIWYPFKPKAPPTMGEQFTSLPWFRFGAFALIALGIWAISQIIWTVVSAAMGVVALGVVVLGAIALVHAVPWLLQMLENWILAARKAEARRRPIEQLQNFEAKKREQVRIYKQAVSSVGAQIRSLGDMIKERKRTKPGSDTSSQEEAIGKMRQAHEIMLKKGERAEEALAQLHELIDNKQFEQKFAEAGNAAMQALNTTSGQALFDSMLADEASSAIRDNFNKVFADLEVEARSLNAQDKIDFGAGQILDVSSVETIPLLAQPTAQPIAQSVVQATPAHVRH